LAEPPQISHNREGRKGKKIRIGGLLKPSQDTAQKKTKRREESEKKRHNRFTKAVGKRDRLRKELEEDGGNFEKTKPVGRPHRKKPRKKCFTEGRKIPTRESERQACPSKKSNKTAKLLKRRGAILLSRGTNKRPKKKEPHYGNESKKNHAKKDEE